MDASNFKKTREGFSKVCVLCLEKQAQRDAERRRAKQGDKVNFPAEEEGLDDLSDLVVDIDKYLESLQALAQSEEVISLDSRVNFSLLRHEVTSDRQLADLCAKKIWKDLKYRHM